MSLHHIEEEIMQAIVLTVLLLASMAPTAWAGPVSPAAQSGAPTDGQESLRFLRLLAGDRPIGEPMATPVPGIRQVQLDAETVYVTEDGRYAFVGSLIDLKKGKNLTADTKSEISRRLLDDFGDADKVVFNAKGKQKAVVDVFTDTSCPYCRKLHAEVPQLQAAGVTVRYLPYPRGGKQGPGYQGLRRVWCAPDRVKAMNDAKHGESGDGPTGCTDAKIVDQGHQLGNQLGIVGTPTIFLPNGKRIGGYVAAAELLRRLGSASP